MEFLEQARSLLDTLKKRDEELQEIKAELKVANAETLEVLFAEEFEVAMEMSDVFETLSIMLDKMSKSDDTSFIANRIRTQAECIIGNHKEYSI